MYKALLPTICLLACTAIVRGQRIERPPDPSPNGQRTRIDFNALMEEQRAHDFVRRMRILRGADSPTNQSPIITLSAAQIAWISEIARGVPTSSQVHRPESTPLGLTFGGWDPSQGEFSPLNGLTRDLEKLDRTFEEFRLNLDSVSQATDALNKLKLVATANTLTTWSVAPLETSNARDSEPRVTAQASGNNQAVTRCVKDGHRVIVRILPKSWYLGSINDKDCFLAKAVWGDNNQWFKGDVIGNPKLKDVWVLREGFERGALPNGKPGAVLFGDESRDKLEDKYASWTSIGRADGDKTKLLRKTRIFGNYNPETNQYYDVLNQLDPDTPSHEYKVRWITKDGRAAIIRHYGHLWIWSHKIWSGNSEHKPVGNCSMLRLGFFSMPPGSKIVEAMRSTGFAAILHR